MGRDGKARKQMKRVRMGKRKSKRWGGVWTVPGFRKHEHRNKLTKTKSEPKAKPTCINM